jgi:hypothetical protein
MVNDLLLIIKALAIISHIKHKRASQLDRVTMTRSPSASLYAGREAAPSRPAARHDTGCPASYAACETTPQINVIPVSTP